MIDTCIIFGNLIDNAIQACEKIANNNRYINLKIKRNRGTETEFIVNNIIPINES